MTRRYPNLLQPLKVGKMTFRNRIFTAPITIGAVQANERYPTEEVIVHFANKAKGGAACVTCCGVNVFPSDPDDYRISWDIYQKQYVHRLAHLADRIHIHGAKASMEIGAVGVARTDWAVSDGVPTIHGAVGKEMPISEIERYADCFVVAAEALKNAGFDMILLHYGHGLPLGQFLSPLTNHRRDEYGGNLENRARFPILIIDRIQEKVGRDLLIEVRISGSEFIEGGIEVEEAIEFTRMIEDKIDLIHVSAGLHSPQGMTIIHPTSFLPPMPNVFLAENVKKAGVKVPVVAIGGIQDLEGAEKIIADGRADVVAIARGFIADPDLGEKAYAGHGEDVTPCVKCMRCHDSAVWEYHFVCSVNPLIGMEHKASELMQPPATKCKVAVIGGGPAGMKAALVSAERGHDVTLYEKSDSLGGLLKTADTVPFKYDLNRFKTFLAIQVSKANIKVRLNTEATPEMLALENPDVILAALGSEPLIPPIPGVDGKNVMTALEAYGKEAQTGQKFVVIGGGQVGCETALHLAKMGQSVTLLEMLPELAPDATPSQRTEIRLKIEAEKRVEPILQARCTEIQADGVSYVDQDGRSKSIQADNVILAAGMKPRQLEAEAFEGIADRFIMIGDCQKVATVEQAINSAFYAALRI